MAQFTFRLETVYRWKQWQEEAARDQWLQAHRRLSQARAELLLLENELGSLGDRLPNEPIDASTLHAWARYAARTREEAARQQEEVLRAESHTQELHSRLVQASQERRLFERLREKAWLRYRLEQEHQEQRFQDELAGVRAAAVRIRSRQAAADRPARLA
ncbi:MAG: flagellar export protein FliJ [Bacillota bacterium]